MIRAVLFCFGATFSSFTSSASRGHDDDDYDGSLQSNAAILSTQLIYIIATIIIIRFHQGAVSAPFARGV